MLFIALVGIIYQYPHFLTGGTIIVPPTFQDTGEEYTVIRGDLWRLNYTKTIFRPHQGG